MNQYYASEFIHNKIEGKKIRRRANGSYTETEFKEHSQQVDNQSNADIFNKRNSVSKRGSIEGDQKKNISDVLNDKDQPKRDNFDDDEDDNDSVDDQGQKVKNSKRKRSSLLKNISTKSNSLFSKEPLLINLDEFQYMNRKVMPLEQKVLYFLLFSEQQDNSLEQLILKIGANTGAVDETGMLERANYAPLFTKQKEQYLMKVDELQSPIQPQKKLQLDNQQNELLDNIPSPQRLPTNYKRTPLRQQSLLLELRKIDHQGDINSIKEEEDESQQIPQKKDSQDQNEDQIRKQTNSSQNSSQVYFNFQERGQGSQVRRSQKSQTTLKSTGLNKEPAGGNKVVGSKIYQSPNRHGDDSSRISSDKLSSAQREAEGAISEEKLQMMRLEQKVAIQMAAPNRDITNAFKSKFIKDTSSSIKKQTYLMNKEKEEELFIYAIEQKIDKFMKIQFEELSTLPDQIVREFSRILESELLEGQQGQKNIQPNNVLLFRHELQFFNWALLDYENDEDDKTSVDSRSKDMFDYHFCLVTRKREKRVFEFILKKFRDFSIHHPNLMNYFLVRESNFECLYFHTLKILHLLQVCQSHIFLNSQFTKESTLEIIRFTSKILRLKFYETDITINSIEQFKQTLFEALKDLFGHESYSIFYIRISKDGVIGSSMADYNQKDMKENYKLTKVLEIIHTLVSGSEILSLFSKEQLESLISHWKLHKKFLGMNNHILYHIISKRIRSHLKIIISQEPLPKDRNIFYSLYSNLFKEFNKYLMIPIHVSDDQEKKNWQKELIQISISQNKLELIKKIYSIELDISRIYESQYFSNIRRTFEENVSLFFLTQNVFKSQIRLKEKKLRENGMYPQMIKLMEEKAVIFESLIDTNDQNLENTKIKKESLQKILEESTVISARLHEEIQGKI